MSLIKYSCNPNPPYMYIMACGISKMTHPRSKARSHLVRTYSSKTFLFLFQDRTIHHACIHIGSSHGHIGLHRKHLEFAYIDREILIREGYIISSCQMKTCHIQIHLIWQQSQRLSHLHEDIRSHIWQLQLLQPRAASSILCVSLFCKFPCTNSLSLTVKYLLY